MAESSSDSSELRNYLKDLRSRGGGRVSPSRIPRPDLSQETEHEQKAKPPSNRAAELLNQVAKLGRRKDLKSKPAEDSSPTTSVTISSSKKEVAFDLTADRDRRDQIRSRIPESPKSIPRRKDAPLKDLKLSPSPKRVIPDVNRHQARRSPSPYHKNCQHSHLSSPNSPEPERGLSPKLSRPVVSKSKPSSPKVTATRKPEQQPGSSVSVSDQTDSSKPSPETSPNARESDDQVSKKPSGESKSSTTKTLDPKRTRTTASSKSDLSATTKTAENDATEESQKTGITSKSETKNPESTSKGGSGNQRTSAEYSDTFEETTSSRRQTRSRSLDTGLRRNSRSTNEMTTRSSKRSKSSTVPDWWFPGILPPKHLGGDHLEQLQQLHLGVLDDLFRFQMGLIEKHQQRSETRYKWMNEFVKRNHSYTTWEDYQNDPRARFFSWQKHAVTADLPVEPH